MMKQFVAAIFMYSQPCWARYSDWQKLCIMIPLYNIECSIEPEPNCVPYEPYSFNVGVWFYIVHYNNHTHIWRTYTFPISGTKGALSMESIIRARSIDRRL